LHECVEPWREAGLLDFGREVIELAGLDEFVQVEDETSDRHSEMRGLAARDGTVGKALQRKSDCWVVGGVDPALLSPKVGLRLQNLTSGAEAQSLPIVSMARLKPCPFEEETADPSAAPQDDSCSSG
jgi:hypothetical protein